MNMLKDKVAVITGGSSGIGQAITKKFDTEGAKIVIFGRNEQKLKATTKTLKAATYQIGDVANIADLDALYETAMRQYGKIDLLVVCAGIAETRHIKDVDEDFFDEIIRTNYKGAYFTVQRALPNLNKGASVILISSVAAHIGWPTHSVYASTKAAVSHMAKSLSADLIEDGIRVNAISPGFVDTPMFDVVKTSSPELIEKINNNIPAERFARAEEIAGVALYLASPQSSYMIGEDIVIDGGMKAIFQAKL